MAFRTTLKLIKDGKVTEERETEFEALPLLWDTWNAVCSFMEDAFVRGVYLNQDNTPKGDDAMDGKLGLRFLSEGNERIAKENDWIGRFPKVTFSDGSTMPTRYLILPSEPQNIPAIYVRERQLG